MSWALYARLGVTQDSVAGARGALARQMRQEGEAFIDAAARATMKLPGYERLEFEAVRPNTARAMGKVLETLEGADSRLFGELLEGIAYARARQGLPVDSLFALADITEDMLDELALRCLEGPRALLSGALAAREITDGARTVIIAASQRAQVEALAEVEHLARQFSAPLLPILPRVLALPIIGAVSPARAEQINDAVLEGIASQGADTIILDITGISDVDACLPRYLERIARAARLIGARTVLVGVNAAVARLLVAGGGESLAEVEIHRTLASALLALSRR